MLLPVTAFAQDDARLKKRIAELEAENRALRAIIVKIQSAMSEVPKSSVSTAASGSDGLRIIVVPGDWGESQLTDIRKVCQSAARGLVKNLPGDGFAPILVERSTNGPITLYKRGTGNEFVVRLDTANRAWAQCAFQFSHEFCHIVCNYRSGSNSQKWFEETICETASLFALREMAKEWKTNPPYSNWKSYSTSLAGYVDQRLNKIKVTGSAAEVYERQADHLSKNGTDRELNLFLASKLLPLFEKKPAGWQSLRYLNLGPLKENDSFKVYLNAWHQRVPAKHKPFVVEIAKQFAIEW